MPDLILDPDKLAPGYVLQADGHAWTLDRIEPYTRKDGGASHIVRWHHHCADCGVRVDHTTAKSFGRFPIRCRPCWRQYGRP